MKATTKKPVRRKSLKLKLFEFWDAYDGPTDGSLRSKSMVKFNISLKQYDKWMAQWKAQ